MLRMLRMVLNHMDETDEYERQLLETYLDENKWEYEYEEVENE